jgi:hypothetical protein
MDEAGMTDIPMRLMIAAVLTSLMVPIVLGAYEDLSCSVAEHRALKEMDRISGAARSVLDGDVGSSMDLSVDLRGFGLAGFKIGVIGGPLVGERNASAYMIVFDIDLLGKVLTAPDPPIAMTSEGGMVGLTIGEGEETLMVTHVILGGVHAAAFKRA